VLLLMVHPLSKASGYMEAIERTCRTPSWPEPRTQDYLCLLFQ